MTFAGQARRLLLAAVIGVAVVTALVLGSVALVSGDWGEHVLGLDLVGWTVVAPFVGVVTVGGGAFLILRVLERRRADGMAFIERQVAAIRDGDGALPRSVVGLRDIDQVTGDLARLAGELARQRALDRDFAADASHQLRTPLTVLGMACAELQRSATPAQQPALAVILLDEEVGCARRTAQLRREPGGAEALGGVVHRHGGAVEVVRAGEPDQAVAQVLPLHQDEHQHHEHDAGGGQRVDDRG